MLKFGNLVFMQHNRDAKGELTPLPKPSVDTGMGLERIAAVLQGVQNNYDIDLFQVLITALHDLTVGQDRNNASFKVVVDHIRSCSFLILDGVLPGNEGRGYVLRRIIRRAVRHGHKLGLNEGAFFHKLVAPLCDVMGEAYPDLLEQQAHLEKIIKQEEEQFSRTLTHGLRLLEADIAALNSDTLSGEIAFKLFDTYGFPFDLTADIARERSLNVDEAGFKRAMEAQRDASRAGSQFKNELSSDIKLDVSSEFLGYFDNIINSKIIALLNKEGESVSSMEVSKEKVGIVLEKTPFYAESGGQVGDTGTLSAKGIVFDVHDTQKQGEAIIHYGVLSSGTLDVNVEVKAQIDVDRRGAIRANHSATHLVHAALKAVLGKHVLQKGSLVTADKARFDFSHYEPISTNDLNKVERLVNQQIRLNQTVLTQQMDIDDAKATGAMALFGEKYGDTVRVLSLGDFSTELCGGTHVERSGDIGLCRLTHETGIASGVRRLEFITGEIASEYVLSRERLLNQASERLHTTPDLLFSKIESLVNQQKALGKSIVSATNKSSGSLW